MYFFSVAFIVFGCLVLIRYIFVLICSLFRMIISTSATEITKKGIAYATSKEADESQRTDPSSDEAVEWRK